MATTKRRKTTTSAKGTKAKTTKAKPKTPKTSTAKAKSKTSKTRATSSKTTSKTSTRKAATPKRPKVPSRVSKALTRAQQVTFLSEQTGLSKREVSSVLDCFEPMIASHLRGPGSINLAGLMKVVAIRKPATKARKGINPFTGEETIFKAKPARNVVKVRPLKKVKDLVS